MAEAARPKPRLLATISAYGTADALHSAKVAFQWTDGRIAFERVYHLHTGTIDDWTTDIAEEVVRVGRRIPLVMLSEPSIIPSLRMSKWAAEAAGLRDGFGEG